LLGEPPISSSVLAAHEVVPARQRYTIGRSADGMTGASRTDPCLPDTMAARSRPGATGEHGEPAVRAVRTAVTVHGGTS
jgi:hypothetical protein